MLRALLKTLGELRLQALRNDWRVRVEWADESIARVETQIERVESDLLEGAQLPAG